MGEVDLAAKEFFRDPANFADLFNFKLFAGKQVIVPAQLRELESTEIVTVRRKAGSTSIQRIRDNVRACIWGSKSDGKNFFIVMGLESQTNVDYTMPARCMLSDSISYENQIRLIRKSNKNHKTESVKMTRAEFLCGFRKSDRLMPVITLVLYLGMEQWDGFLSLHEMLRIQDPDILGFVPDYRLNLVQPAGLADSDFSRFHTELGPVLEYIRSSGNKEKLYEITHANDRFKALSPESADLLNLATGSRLTIPDKERKEGKINVCTAIDEMRKESRAEGIAEGMSKGLLSARTDDVKNIMKSLNIPMEQAMDILRVNPGERKAIARHLKRSRFRQ